MKTLLAVAALAAPVALSAQAGVPVKLSEWKIEMPDTLKAGTVSLRVSNTGTVAHALYVRGEGVEKGTRDIAVKQQATLSVALKPGKYEFFCTMADEAHKLAGMKKEVTVVAASPADAKKP